MAQRTGLMSLVCILYALVCLPAVFSAPTIAPRATILGPQPPHFVAYTDESAFGIPAASDLVGYNTLILSFLLASGPADQAGAWTGLSPQQRASLKAGYKANNITLLVSAFGSTESPTTDNNDPTAVAQQMANWVKTWGMDGIDVDYEDFEAVGKGSAVAWLTTFTQVLRDNLPAGEFVITHAPVAPWFGQGQPYAQLNKAVGNLIDWYNVQFYSQGLAYTTCETLIFSSGGDFPGTSVLEIVNSGVPQEKVVLGKPGTPALVGTPIPSDPGSGGTQVASGQTQQAGGDTQVAGGGTQVAGGGTQVASGGTQVASGGTQEVSGSGTQEVSGSGTLVASGGTQEASGGTQVASGGTQVASRGGTQVASGGTQEASGGGTQVASSGGTKKVSGVQLNVVSGATSEASVNTSGGIHYKAVSKGTKMASSTLKASAFGKRDTNVDPHQNGFLEINTLAQCLTQAKAKGWNAGVMVWEFPDANSQWIETVRSLTWPVRT